MPLSEMSVTALRGVGKQLAERLARLGIITVQDVLFHLPRQYEDRTRLMPLGSLMPGMTALIEGEVLLADIVAGRRRSLAVRISDGTGTLTLRFYHFHHSQKESFKRGQKIRAFGEVRRGAAGQEMYHPEYEGADVQPEEPERCLTPVYPSTEGVTQARLRDLTGKALEWLTPDALPDFLTAASLKYTLVEALRYLHRPPSDAPIAQLIAGRHAAQQRLILEELLAHQLSLLQIRAQARQLLAPSMPLASALMVKLRNSLPFQLTSAQTRVLNEICSDLKQKAPMLRLVQGDVGCGKTAIAALAACHAIDNGVQVALMAPTELLSAQHYQRFQAWFSPLGIEVGSINGKQPPKLRQVMRERIARGDIALIIGTHALFQEDIQFSRLGLIIIDEQHRFGVHQRLALREKGNNHEMPHQLIMTATPIPRTLAMSAYGDLDTSLIDELPPGRTAVTTLAVPQERRQEVITRIKANCQSGHRAYWVCTLIEESESLAAQAAQSTFEALKNDLPELRIGLVHGRLKPSEKAQVMEAFARGELQLLVATTVIEVGVDVPEASLMVIENPERLGLAQLHQLRGRVGRGSAASYCVLLYQAPLGEMGRARLSILRQTNDGFVIAERDLELRGPGEVLGTRQTGLLQYRIADLVRDQHMLPQAQDLATRLMRQAPQNIPKLIRRWIGEGERYAQV